MNSSNTTHEFSKNQNSAKVPTIASPSIPSSNMESLSIELKISETKPEQDEKQI